MTFQEKMKIHDAMIILHRDFMETTKKFTIFNIKENEELIDALKSLIHNMKDLAKLVDKALELVN